MRVDSIYKLLLSFVNGRLILFFVAVFFMCTQALVAQISISGAAYVEAKEDKLNHLRVFVLASPEVSVSIAGPAGGELYRYSTKANDAERVSDASLAADGVSWQMEHPLCDRGYFVRKEGQPTVYYWLIDYKSYPLPMLTLEAFDAANVCVDVRLVWAENLREMIYYTPLGVPQRLSRAVEVAYRTLRYAEKTRSYTAVDTVVYIEPKGQGVEMESSLMDTDYAIVGDAFQKSFGMAYEPVRSGIYLTKRLDLHPYVDLVVGMGETDTKTEQDFSNLSAPQEVQLTVVANEPIAALYNWSVYPVGEALDAAILRFSGKETNYTFRKAGRYTIALEVTTRDGRCADRGFSRDVQIRESMLDVPNAFSPGSSPGINDVFRVRYKSLVSFEATIFDRAGQRIVRWTDPASGWDGYIGGKLAPTGVYFYVITAQGADGETYNLRGHVNILQAEQESSLPGGGNQPSPSL